MATAVEKTTQKVISLVDAAPKKSAPKNSESAFDVELKKARPKPAHTEAKAAPKKAKHAGKHKAEKAKPDSDEKESEVHAKDETDVDQLPEEQRDDQDSAHPARAEKPKTESIDPKADDAATTAAAEQNPAAVIAQAKPEAKQQQKCDPDADQEDAQNRSDQPAAKVQGTARSTEAKAVAPKGEKVADAQLATTTDVDPEAATTDENADQDQPAPDAQAATKVAKKPATTGQQPVKIEPIDLGPAPQVEQTSQPKDAEKTADTTDTTTTAVAEVADHVPAPAAADEAPAPVSHDTLTAQFAADLQAKSPEQTPIATTHQAAPAPEAPPAPPEVRFAEANHPQIVTGMRGQLLPDGGTMHIRLDPPELGALQVSVHMQDGVMTASFQTSNDEATKLLSHSLGQLKHVLESSGVSVDKLHVSQTPRDQQASNEDNRQQQGQSDNPSARQEQQRREILQRMWRRLANGSDPLDMVA